MINFDTHVSTDCFFKNGFGEVSVIIERSPANMYTLIVTLLNPSNNLIVNKVTNLYDHSIGMKELQFAVETMTKIQLSSPLNSDSNKALVTFWDQFNRTNARKRIGKMLKALTEGLKRGYEHMSEVSKTKGNLFIELVKKNYVDLATHDLQPESQKVFIKMQVVVDKLGDYSFIMYYNFLVGEQYISGRVLLKEKLSNWEDFLSMVRKGLLVAKTRNILSVFDVETFYKDCALFSWENRRELDDVVNRLNARLPL